MQPAARHAPKAGASIAVRSGQTPTTPIAASTRSASRYTPGATSTTSASPPTAHLSFHHKKNTPEFYCQQSEQAVSKKDYSVLFLLLRCHADPNAFKSFDSFVIASVLDDGLDKAGVFALAKIVTSIIQAPQRGIVSAAMPHLSRAWKEKNMELLQKVYQRSSINQLLFACGIFLLIWLNFRDGVTTFGLKPVYLDAAWVFFVLGITVIIDMGTGVNAQIIVTSTYWKFELISGVVLLIIMLPLTYLLTKQYGIIGPAFATLVSMSIYNLIRIIFLWKKFRLFPFSVQ